MALPKPRNLVKVEKKLAQLTKPVKLPYDPAKQVAGYKTRLTAAGVPASQIKDTRNPVERLLNVKPDQPWFFDVLEIADRPRSALVGSITALQKNESPIEGIIKGLSGEKDTSWKEVFTNMGAVDRPGQLDVVDVIGTAMDIFVDPIDWALFPVSAFASKAGANLLKDTVSSINNYNKLFNNLDDTLSLKNLIDPKSSMFRKDININAFKNTFNSLANRLIKTVKSDITTEMSDSLRKAANATTVGEFRNAVQAFGAVADKRLQKSALDLTVLGFKNSIGYSVGFLDDSITKILTKMDINKIKTDPKFLKDFKAYGNSVLNVTIYKDLKEWVQGIFDATSRLPQGLMDSVKGVKGNQKLYDEYAKSYLKSVDDVIERIAKETGVEKSLISKQILNHIEYEDLQYTTSLWNLVTDKDAMKTIAKTKDEADLIKKFLSRVTDKRGKKIYTEEALNKIFNVVSRKGVDYYYYDKKSIDYIKKSVENYLALLKSEKVKIKGSRALFYRKTKEQLLQEMKVGRFYDDAFIKRYAKFKGIESFDQAVQEVREIVKDMYKTIDNLSTSGYSKKIKIDKRFSVSDQVSEFESAILDEGKRVIVPRETLPDAKQLLKATESETYKIQRLKGNVKVSSERVYRMSAYEANQMIKATTENLLKNSTLSDQTRTFLTVRKNQELFSEYINTSLADFVINKSNTAFQTSIVDNVIMAGVFSDPNLVGAYKGGRIPLGKSTFPKQTLIKKLEDLKPYHIDRNVLEEGIKSLRGVKSQSILIENNVLDLLALPKDSDQVKEALRLFDKLNSFFKNTKLLSPGFHIRNFIGNFSNMMLAGVNPIQAGKYQDDVFKIMSTGPELLRRATKTGAHLDPSLLSKTFNAQELRLYNILVDYTRSNLPKSASALYDYPEALEALIRANPEKKNVWEQVSAINGNWNENVDTYFRLQTFIYGRENPQLLGRLGAQNAAELTRRVHFDPNDLSPTERNVLKRIIPFYTYTKKNLAFQMKNVFDNPKIYKRLTKAMDSAWTTMDIDPRTDLEEYKRTNYWIPIWKKKDGKYITIKANLPVGDLVEFLSSPGNRILSSVAPTIRMPFELALNRQVYSGLPIQDFPGQKGYMFPQLSKIPVVGGLANRRSEYLLAQTGLDVPFNLLYGAGEAAYNIATGEQDVLSGLVSGPLSSGFSEGSKEKALKSKAYEELERMQQLVSYYKQQGVDIPTLADIENKNNSLNQLRKRMKSKFR